MFDLVEECLLSESHGEVKQDHCYARLVM